ncbi:MAG: PAS domain S-box protein [Bacteroidota bacterium]|nr:MAG: PAS domain S-box protein [Bacteroidota bacterium]
MIDQIEFDLLKEDNKKLLHQLELIRHTVILKSYKLGTDFFNALVTQLNEALKADFTFIGKLCNDSDIQTLSVFSQNALQANFSYTLANTPCATLIGNPSCCYSDKVTELFPDDHMLIEMGVSGYLGVSLFDSKKQATGILVSLFKRPIQDALFKETLLLIYASQAGGELEHMNHYRQLEESRKELELKHTELAERNKELHALEEELRNTNEQLFRSNEVLVVSEQIASIQNQRLANLFNNVPDGLILESYKGIVLRVNKKFCELFELNLPPVMLEEANSRQVAERVSNQFLNSDAFLDRTDSILREGKRVSGEELELKDGRFFERDFFPVGMGEGQIEKLWVYRDVSARKVREKSEKKLTQRIEAALRSGNMAWWEVELPSGKMVFDKRKAEMLGYNPDEFNCIDDFGKYIHPEDKENADRCMELCITGQRKIYEAEYRILNRQGNYRWFFDTGEIVERNTEKGITWIVGLVEDITERKEAEQSLRESEERLELSINGAGLGLWMWNMQTGATTYNERWAEILGYSLKELIPTTIDTWNQLVHPEDMAVSVEALHSHVLGKSEFYECEVRMRHKDGHWVWVLDRGKVFERDKAGNPLRMSGTQSDISARKATEAELHLTQMRYSDFVNVSNDLVSYWKLPDGLSADLPTRDQHNLILSAMCLDANRAFLEAVGLNSKDEMIGVLMKDFLDYTLYREAINTFIQANYKIVNFPTHAMLSNGKEAYNLASWYGITEDNELKYIWAVGKNITELKLAEIQIQRNEKQLQLIFDNSPVIMMLLNEHAEILRINKTGKQYSGLDTDSVRHRQPGDLLNCIETIYLPQGCGTGEVCKSCTLRLIILEAISSGMGVTKIETSVRIQNKEYIENRDITISVVPAIGENEKTYLLTIDDITDRKLAEKALEESYSKFKALADYTYDWEYWIGPDDRYIYISPSCERISGYKAEEFVNNPQLFDSIVLEEDRFDWMQHSKNLQHLPGNENPIEFRILTRKGKIKWISHVCRQVTDTNGSYRGVRATNRDITVQKLSQIALTESEMRFKQLAEISQEGIIIHKNGVLIDANKAFLALTGYKFEEILGTNFFDTFFSSQDRELAIDRTTQDYNLPWEVEIYKNNSKTFLAEILSKKISTSQPLRAVSVRDISEQKQMQQKILHAIIQTEEQERRRVAQDLHDGLGPILSTIKLLSQTYMNTQNEEFRNKLKDQLLSGIEEALDQTSSIANNLSPHVLIDFGLKVAIQKFIEKVQRINELKVVFAYDLADPIQSDVEITLYRVTIELINNTLKHSGASEMNIVYKSSVHNIYFHFSDNGSGFQFEEKRNANTSMGLFNIVNRVKSLGGTVFFENPSQGGIRYEICLPNKNTD